MFNSVGQKLGNYHLVRPVDHGGFADIYLGLHIYLKTEAAVKVLHTHLPGNLLKNFLIEARHHAQLIHPNIVQVLDFGVENNTPFLVMNYAPNGTLRQRHPVGSVLEPATIVSYVNQIAAALHYAHTHNIIHRDIKPENMLINNEDTIMLSDFGIAIALHNFQHARKMTLLSLETMIVGTTTYMAPEQFLGTATFASDQYSLAAVVYEWFCGTPPFTGTDFQIAIKHLHKQPPSLRDAIPTLAPAIDTVMMRALEKDPQKRFADVKQFADALEAACAPAVPLVDQATTALLPSLHSAHTISIPRWDHLLSSIEVMYEKTEKFLADHLLLFSKPLSASTKLEKRTLAPFHQLTAATPTQSQSIVLEHATASIPIPVRTKQTKNSLLTAEQMKFLLLSIAVICMIGTITLSLLPFIQANLRTPEKQAQTIITPLPTKIMPSVVPITLQTPPVSSGPKHSPTPTPIIPVIPVGNPAATATPEPTLSPIIPTPTPTPPTLVVVPSALSLANCVPHHHLYRCIVTLTFNSSSSSQLNWQISSINAQADIAPKHGTLSPGQSQQVIIDAFRTCPANGFFVFSGSGISASASWNC